MDAGPGATWAERFFLWMARRQGTWWPFYVGVGATLALLGIVGLALRLVGKLDVLGEGTFMILAGVTIVEYAMLLHGAHDFLQRNGHIGAPKSGAAPGRK